MERREEMTLAEFINAVPVNLDRQWFDLLEISELQEIYAKCKEQGDLDQASAAEADFIRANEHRTVSIWWPSHATRREINGDCTCSLLPD